MLKLLIRYLLPQDETVSFGKNQDSAEGVFGPGASFANSLSEGNTGEDTMRVIIALVALFLCACSKGFLTLNNDQILQSRAFAHAAEPVPDDGVSDEIPSTNTCSNKGSNSAETNLLKADDGVAVALHSVTSRDTDADSSNLVRVLNEAGQSSNFRDDLINEKKLKLNVSGFDDGIYSLLLCDRRLASDGNCSNVRGRIAGYKGDYYINVSGGRVVASGDFRTAAAGKKISAMNVLYDINVKPAASDTPVADDGDGDQDQCDKRASPLVIDLSGSGIYLSKPLEGVLFDIRGEGVRERISWPQSRGSVFLVLDRNRNGNIDSVHEMFGNNTRGPDGRKAANGFEALRKYDSNRDNKIDRVDRAFSELAVWSDSNRNGVSERGELKPLDSALDGAGIASLELDYVEKQEVDQFGNATIQRALTHMSDGSARKTVDIWFRPIPVR